MLAVIVAGPVSWAGYTLFLVPYLLSRRWTSHVWLAVLMLGTPFWLVRHVTLLGALPSALLGAIYGWAVLLLLATFLLEQTRQAAEAREEAVAVAA
jgi:hypothetical protein